MNQIEKKKRYEVESSDPEKRDYHNTLYLTNRQVSALTASFVLLAFFVFIAGYFLGQRKALERFNAVMQDTVDTVSKKEPASLASPEKPEDEKALPTKVGPIVTQTRQYKAQLIGFGTSRAAHKFADKLQNKNVPVRVDERFSKTAQGKEIIWYQVSTEPFTDKQELMSFVEKIKKEERLKDIHIVTC